MLQVFVCSPVTEYFLLSLTLKSANHSCSRRQILRHLSQVSKKIRSPAWKELTSWLSFVMYNCDVTFTQVPGSGVVLDCIDS